MTDHKDTYLNDDDLLDVPLEEASDFQSDLDDVIDADQDFDAEEEGIFEAQPKKKTSKALLSLLVLLLAGGAAGYYYLSALDTPLPAPVINNASVDDVVPLPPEEGLTLDQAQTDAAPVDALSALPQPVSGFDAPVLPETVPAPDATAVAPETPIVEDDVAAVPTPGADAPAVPATPEKIEPLATPAPKTEAFDHIDGPLTPELPVVEARAEIVPDDQAALAPVVPSVAPAGLPQHLQSSEVKTPEKPKDIPVASATAPVKKTPMAQTEYFDAPKGASLKNFAPPPSINPFGEPGENIIIVRKVPNESVIVSKGEENSALENKVVSASRAMALGKYDAALNFYNELRKKNPRDPRILMGRAVALQKLGENQQAVDAYNDLLDIEPQNPEAMTNLMGLIGKTQPAVALQNLLELRQKFPRNASVAAQLGVAYAQSGNPQDGIRNLQLAAQLEPNNPVHFFNMAVLSEQMNDSASAIKYYEQALDVSSINPDMPLPANFTREQIYDRLARLR